MAIIQSSPWADAASFGHGLGESLTNLLIKLPEIRAQQALLAAHQQLYGAQSGLYESEAERARAQTGLYGAETKKTEAQTGEISSTEAAKRNIGIAMGQIPTTLQLGGSIDPLISDVLRELPKLSHAERAGLAESMAQFLESDKPRFRTALGLGSKMTQPVSSQGSIYNVVSGQPEFQMPQKLGYGQELFPISGYPTVSGSSIAVGQDRPLAAQNLGGVLGAFAGASAKGTLPEDVPSALTNFLNTVNSVMPNYGRKVVPPTTNAPPTQKVIRDPKTGKLRLF